MASHRPARDPHALERRRPVRCRPPNNSHRWCANGCQVGTARIMHGREGLVG
jgi:hypothetical protein